MKLLTELDSLDNVKDGETRKLITKATNSGSGNVVSSVSVSGDTITYTKGVTALTAHQNAFSNVKVGSTTVAADSAGDTLELVAGSNITLTPDATNDKVIIAASQPTVNNGTLTIQKNGTNVQTFSANQSSNVTANITVPTKVSQLTNDSGYTTNTGTITGVSVNGTSVATSGVANITSMPASILSGAIPSAVTATTQSVSDNSTKLATTAFVKTAIDNLPEPMVFKGSLGTGGTVTALPVDGSATVGDTYKVITAGTYASKAAKVGDTFICLTKTSSANTWELIPSGDEPSGTVTSITLKATSPIAIDSSSAITTSGTRTLSHANSGVTAGTYRSVTVNATGHVTAGTNPTTLSGYGITDAKIDNGVITLGSNTITPLTSHQDISGKLDKTGGAITGAITRSLASSGTIANTNLFTVSGSTDGFKVDYASTTADVGITTLSTTDDANAKISIGNTVSSTYKEAISVTNGSAVVNGYTVAAASAKAVDTSISAASTSANLPTSAAVASFVEGKNYNYSIDANSGTGTIDDLAAYTSGKPGMTGSINITKKSSGIGSEIAGGWYNFIFSPHRTGSGGDNSNYGNIILMPMTGSGTSYILRRSSSSTTISEVKPIITTDTKNTAGSTNTSSKIFLIGATSQAANPQTYSDDQVYVTSGTLQANILNSTTRINANTALSGTAGGLALYGTNADPSQYGVTMRNTGTTSGNLGKHGYVQGDWAEYFCFDGATNRGWVFRQAGNNVASIGGTGNAVFNGSVTIGGNSANTSGARMEFNSTDKCIEFNFV